MDTGFAVLALLMAFTGFFMLVGGFGVFRVFSKSPNVRSW